MCSAADLHCICPNKEIYPHSGCAGCDISRVYASGGSIFSVLPERYAPHFGRTFCLT